MTRETAGLRVAPAGTHGALRAFIAALLLVYCAKQVLIVVLFPPFTGHDEVAHYEYVRIVAREGRLPTLAEDRLPGRFFEKYRDYALQWEDLGQWTTPLYTAVHPPLYYAAMVPVYKAGQALPPVGKHYLLRFAAIPFGVLTVLFAFWLTRAVFPADAFLAVTVPTLVAFQPQVSYAAAIINNDILAIALYSALLCLLARLVRDGITLGRALVMGAVLGLGLLAKTTTATALPLIAAAFWMARRDESMRRVGTLFAVTVALALAMVAPWYVFMYRTYGDLTGLRDLAEIQTTLLQTELGFLQLLFSGEFAFERWRETWGEFGWRMIPAPGWLLSATALMAIACAVGLTADALSSRAARAATLERWQWQTLLILLGACVVAYLAVVQFGTVFLLAQARYYFPAINAAALLAMLGLRALVSPRWLGATQMVVIAGIIAINVVIYTSNVVPYFYFRP